LAADEVMLDLQDVDAGYGDIEVLMGVSIQVRSGQFVSILGANGAGKSTLLKTIYGLVRPTSGRIMYQGRDINKEPPIQRLRSGICYVPEGRSNFPEMTVQENLEMGAYLRKDTKNIYADIESLVTRFPILKEKRYIAAGNLSGGQQQMLEIAIALMQKPKILMVDEPTLGLAPILVTAVLDELKAINTTGTTVLLVEQNAKRALEISDYSYVLELGRVRFEGPAQELSQNEKVIEAYLGER
jgi:branched-chain amino acid transport system ATP-binding protein